MPKSFGSSMVVDIETFEAITPELMEAASAKFKAPANWKDPKKIAANIEEQKQKFVEKAALSPRTGRIVCVGIGLKETSKTWENHCFIDTINDEPGLLRMVDEALADIEPVEIYTFNGRKFDFPFLAIRSMIHGLTLEHKWPIGWDRRHLDLFDLFGKDGSLNVWSAAILGKTKPSMGNEIDLFVREKRWEELKEHNIEDLVMVEEIVERANLTTEYWRK